jgi:phytoene dehydrogenase-like protein
MSVSRRELLKAFAAAPFLACSGRVAGRAIAGTIVGGAHRLGHRLREGFRPSPQRREEVAVAILGAGVAGLSAAWRFERAGFGDCMVVELEGAAGGTARSGTGPVTPYPWGAHYVPVPSPTNRPLVMLLEEIGAVAGRDAQGRPVYREDVLCRDPQERIFFKGEWYEGLYPKIGASALELRQLEAFEAEMRRWADWRDARGRRAFAIPRRLSSDAPEVQALDRHSMADYLEARGWTSPRLRWFVEYATRDDFGSTLRQTSAWAGVHYFASRLEAGEEEPAEFLTWPEGNGRLVRHLAGVVGPKLRLNTLVTQILPARDHVDVRCFDAARAEAFELRARHVVYALPRFLLAHLLSAPERASSVDAGYGSWMVANLTLNERPATRGFPLAWDNVIYESPSLGYVVATHQSGRDHGPTVLTYYLPLVEDDVRQARTRLLTTPWQEWVDAILRDLGPSHPGLRDLVERVDVYLWGHAMVRPSPGLLWSSALREASRPVGRLHFAHTDLSGIALFEEAQYWGIRAAEAVLRQSGTTFATWLGD